MITVYVALKSKKLNEDFCTAIEKSNYAKVTDTFFSLKDCKAKLAVSAPHILLLGLDFPDGYWADFCREMQEIHPDLKILAVTTYEEYTVLKNALDNFTSGYISKDAVPKVIVSAIKTVMAGDYFRYDKSIILDEKEEQIPEWVQTMLQPIIDTIKADDNPMEGMEKMSHIIRALEKERRLMMNHLMTDENAYFDQEQIDKYLTQLIENMIVQGHANWKIAETLNVGIETVRLYRMEFILRVSGKNSMLLFVKKDGQKVQLGRREVQLLRLIAAGYTTEEIADDILYVDKETVKTIRKNMIQKFEAKNAMTMVISAMRLGLIKIEEIDDLLTS